MKECLRLPQDENGKYYNPKTRQIGDEADLEEYEDDYTDTGNETETEPEIDTGNDLIDRDIIDRDIIDRGGAEDVITRDLPTDQDYIEENYNNISTKGKFYQ